jgi:hypothetical protein
LIYFPQYGNYLGMLVGLHLDLGLSVGPVCFFLPLELVNAVHVVQHHLGKAWGQIVHGPVITCKYVCPSDNHPH